MEVVKVFLSGLYQISQSPLEYIIDTIQESRIEFLLVDYLDGMEKVLKLIKWIHFLAKHEAIIKVMLSFEIIINGTETIRPTLQSIIVDTININLCSKHPVENNHHHFATLFYLLSV